MTVLTDQSIELSQLTFHYREAGNPSAPPLILLHALGANAHDWNKIAPGLAERSHVFALDQRGHSESARPGIYSLELMRDDLKAFADGLALSRFTLTGHSMGGTVASLFSEQWPERIERLVLEDTVPPYPGSLGPSEPELPVEAPEAVPFDWRMLTSIVHQLYAPASS